MYSYKNIIPNNYQSMYKNNNQVLYNDGDRFFLAPFVVGGLAGTALGYGLANNNQLNNISSNAQIILQIPVGIYSIYASFY